MQIFLVGGAVRDALLNRPVTERDWVVVGATPEQMLEKGFTQVGKDFPVFLHPHTKEEFALARTERKAGKGYTGFTCYAAPDVTLEDDLVRRDLTINAMAMAEDQTLIDPYGGQQDLAARTLRHVSEAFTEDPLRVLRVDRFAARYAYLGFTVADETCTLMKQIAHSNELGALTAERVWQETRRSLMEDDPQVFFEVLESCNALSPWFSALSPLSGSRMLALKTAALADATLEVRAATLSAGMPEKDAADLFGTLRAPNTVSDTALLAARLYDKLHQASLSATDILALFTQADAWRKPERFADILRANGLVAASRGDTDHWLKTEAMLTNALSAANHIDTREIAAEGHKGPAMRDAIAHARLNAIANSLENNR